MKINKFKKARYCPNASAVGSNTPWVVMGSIVRYYTCVGFGMQSYGRVLGLTKTDGCGKLFRNAAGKLAPHLVVLQLSDDLSFGYYRFVGLDAVTCVVDRGAFIHWFLSEGFTQSKVEDILGLEELGALSNEYISKYTLRDGKVREDWQHVFASGRVPPPR